MPYSYDRLEDLVNYYVMKGYDEQRIFNACSNDSKAFKTLHSSELPHFQKDVQIILAKHENYATIQKAINSKLYMLMDQKNKIVAYDLLSNTDVDFGEHSLTKIMDPTALKPRLNLAFSEFEPHTTNKIYKDHRGQTIFNRYSPPAWKRAFFFHGTPIEAKPMPVLYHKFILSLLDNDVESYNYLINWVAISLKQKTMKMLGLIGKPRIGKGMLAQIVASLHGVKEGNGVFDVSGGKLGEKFNAILDARTFVEFSEFKIETPNEKNNWKNLINTTFEMEKKGVDAKMTANHANIFISSNDMKHVKIGTSDQRLSLLNLTDKLLLDRLPDLGFKTEKEVAEAVLDPSNIAELAAYLWNYPADLDMGNRVFQSKTLENLHKSQLHAWMKEFLCNYCSANAGKDVKLIETIEWLNKEMDSRLKLKSDNFQELMNKLDPMLKKYKGLKYFEMPKRKKDQSGFKPILLRIMPLDKQPPEDFLDEIDTVEDT